MKRNEQRADGCVVEKIGYKTHKLKRGIEEARSDERIRHSGEKNTLERTRTNRIVLPNKENKAILLRSARDLHRCEKPIRVLGKHFLFMAETGRG